MSQAEAVEGQLMGDKTMMLWQSLNKIGVQGLGVCDRQVLRDLAEAQQDHGRGLGL